MFYLRFLLILVCLSLVAVYELNNEIFTGNSENPSYPVCYSNVDTDEKTSENLFDQVPFRYDGFRMGPILLKVDEEWLNEGKYLKIGLSREDSFSKDYDMISPKSKSIETTLKEMKPEESDSVKYVREVDIYKIDFSNKKMWIDLNILILSYHDSTNKTIVYRFFNEKKFFIFHPLQNKWWGIHYEPSFENTIFQVMNTKLYKKSNKKSEIENLLINSKEKLTKEKIIDERTLIIPSLKFYRDKFGDLIEKYKLYSWYVDKDEIEPKKEDE